MSAAAILKLQAAGFTAEQVTAIAELVDTQSATKADLDAAEQRLEHRFDVRATALQGEVNILKWMMGFVLAFQVAIFAKLFLH